MALSQITWQDVQQLPDDGHRHEAIEGELYMTGAPIDEIDLTGVFRAD
jgi:hypothetical protein